MFLSFPITLHGVFELMDITPWSQNSPFFFILSSLNLMPPEETPGIIKEV